MPRKSAPAKKVQKSAGKSASKSATKSKSASKPQAVLKLSDIMNATSYSPAPREKELPPGFEKVDKHAQAKVSPFSKAKSGGYSYEYPKGSPFKMVTQKKTQAQKVANIVEAVKGAAVQKAESKSAQKKGGVSKPKAAKGGKSNKQSGQRNIGVLGRS